mmetsp:Transcript_55250/g.135299  ORF Transcript_55250/g.135299 Transcript_55250/m.135299 type:complete len:2074 (-) Transcript_55250:274-6495(-)
MRAAASVLCAVALLLALVEHQGVQAASGDVIAASDFRLGTQGWTLAGSGWSSEGLQSEGDLIAALDAASTPAATWYYAAPPSFVNGDKTLAYNGFLSFDFGHFEYESMGEGSQGGYDIMLFGRNKKQTIGLKGVFQVDDTKLSKSYNVRLEETFSSAGSDAMWELVNVLKPVEGRLVTKAPTQHEFVTTLQQLSGIWIRGSYFKGAEATWLKNVRIIEGIMNKGSATGREETAIVNGNEVQSASTTPAAATGCCSSRTCVSNDMYEIEFDRPGCMQAPDTVCCSDGQSDVTGGNTACDRYSKQYDESSAATIVRGTDYNEGRKFTTPGTVTPCWGAGPTSPSKSACFVKAAGSATASIQPVVWDSGTKNQNIGDKGLPIRKPFVKDYYMNAIPKICSAATLTVTVHGDIADPLDYIEVYGEDEEYLGKLFAGNLTYMFEGQRPYDPNTELWNCDGRYDPNVAGTATNVREADPHHPSGAWPKVTGYRGGVDTQPGVYGQENTHCKNWARGGDKNPSLEFSETLPFIDSIAIPQEKMMQYSADQQIRFTFRTWRRAALENVFSGTGGGGTTSACLFNTHAAGCGSQACDGCDLDGKVLFRTIKLKFSAAACYTKKIATDKQEVFLEGFHAAQPLNIPLSFNVPTGSTGMPGGDGTLSVVVGADIFGLDKFISVYTPAGEKIGDLFRTESSGGLRSRMSDDFMVKTTSFGATDAPVPFRTATNCDTSSPITVTDMCTPADNQWRMGMEFVNYTDTLVIPRTRIEQLSVNGKLTLYLKSDVPGSAFSPSTEYGARISPITLSFPLLHCFMRAIKSGPNFGIYLERPRSYYFMEKGLPLPGGDVTVMFVAHWQRHVRYVPRHVGPGAATVANAYDGLEDGLSVLRVDKDTVAEMGTVWVYKDQDGVDCCPAVYRPDFAGKKYQVPKSSNCIAGGCTDPDESTTDTCTYDQPCGKKSLQGPLLPGAGTQESLTLDDESTVDQIFVGLNIILGWPLDALTATGSGFCAGVADGTGFACTLSGGGGSGYGDCTYDVTAGVVSNVLVTLVGTGFESPPVALPRYDHDCQRFSFTWLLDVGGGAGGATDGAKFAGIPRTILSYDGTSQVAVVSAWPAPAGALSAAAGATTAGVITAISYRITGEGISQFNRNALDGGTTTGTVIVPISSDAVCQTRTVASGFIDSLLAPRVVRLDTTETTAANDAYNGYTLSVRNVNSAEYTDYDVTAYAGTITGNLAAGNATTLTLAVPAVVVPNQPTSDLVAAQTVNNWFTKFSSSSTYTDVTALNIEIDLDGNPASGDDVYTRVIRAQAGAVLTIDDLDPDTPYLPTPSTTFKIYAREATVSTALPANAAGSISSPGPSDNLLTLPAAATNGTLAVVLNAGEGPYDGHKLTIYHATGSVHSYICVAQTALVCTINVGLVEAIAIGDTYAFFRPFKLYQALSPTCLAGANLRITYTAGNAKTVSNDPGELDTIYSNWDSSSGNLVSETTQAAPQQTGKPSTRDVRSWVIKLTGDGYFDDLYRQQGVGAFATTTTAADFLSTNTTLALTSTSGISVGMYLKLSDNLVSPAVEIVRVRSITSTSAGTIVVSRAEMGSQQLAGTLGTGATVLPTGNNVDGNGLDDMAAYGGLSRYTSTTNDAYTGLGITIFEGTGAGQTRTIVDYHGASRTAYLNTQWNVIPDDTSRYRIFYSALISDVVFPGISGATDPTWALATFPRPVRQGYLWQIEWYDCATAVVNAEGFSGTQNANSLPQCPGSLRMRIPKQGPVTDTTFANTGLNIAQANIYYTMREVDITRQEYPEMIEQHKKWPHGYSYMKFMAGEDGELLGNVFLKDYTQYNTASYYTDTITVPRDRFETYVRQNGDFHFTLQTPPGTSNIELLSVVISYPVTKEADASIYDANTLPTTRVQSHGPPPFFPASRAWSGADEFQRTAATHPRFQTHSYTSTCGNGVRDGNEYCDDGNEVDGDGCSSSCQLESGWTCATVQIDQPSVCYQGAQGARIPDPAVGCKYYACQRPAADPTAAYSLTGTRCSGFPKDDSGDVPICLDGLIQGECTLCVGWGTSPADTQIAGFSGRTAYRR